MIVYAISIAYSSGVRESSISRSFKGVCRYLQVDGHEHITSCLFYLYEKVFPLEGRKEKGCARHVLGYCVMDEKLCKCYEKLICKAFRCKKSDFGFASADYCRDAQKHPEALKAYLLSALIILKGNNDVFLKCIEILESEFSLKSARMVLDIVKQSNSI